MGSPSHSCQRINHLHLGRKERATRILIWTVQTQGYIATVYKAAQNLTWPLKGYFRIVFDYRLVIGPLLLAERLEAQPYVLSHSRKELTWR